MRDEVILVDAFDRPIGVAEKQQAHVDGRLHRAFSIFVFNAAGKLLLQKRAAGKYHSPGLWSNTCCSHPRPGEALEDAAQRRLREEMGFACALRKAFHFTYRAELANGLVEHEFDHVFVGVFDGQPVVNADEADACEWVDLATLQISMRKDSAAYSAWLHAGLKPLLAHLQQEPLLA